MLRESKTFVWVACYSNCLCSKVHFLWKESKTKKIILTPCAIKLSFIRHGFCHSQRVCVLFRVDIFKGAKTDQWTRLRVLIPDTEFHACCPLMCATISQIIGLKSHIVYFVILNFAFKTKPTGDIKAARSAPLTLTFWKVS